MPKWMEPDAPPEFVDISKNILREPTNEDWSKLFYDTKKMVDKMAYDYSHIQTKGWPFPDWVRRMYEIDAHLLLQLKWSEQGIRLNEKSWNELKKFRDIMNYEGGIELPPEPMSNDQKLFLSVFCHICFWTGFGIFVHPVLLTPLMLLGWLIHAFIYVTFFEDKR